MYNDDNNNNNNNNNDDDDDDDDDACRRSNIFLLGKRLRNVTIEILKDKHDNHPQLCYHRTLPADRILDVPCSKRIIGSWVRIRKEKITVQFEPLTLCEVIITGTRAGILFFTKCTLSFHWKQPQYSSYSF